MIMQLGNKNQVLKQTYETAGDCLKTNYYGIKQLTEALIPLLQQSDSARIVNVSSELGQLRVHFRNPCLKSRIHIVGLTPKHKMQDNITLSN